MKLKRMKRNRIQKVTNVVNHRFLTDILRTNKRILREQQGLVNRYEKLAADQKR